MKSFINWGFYAQTRKPSDLLVTRARIPAFQELTEIVGNQDEL